MATDTPKKTQTTAPAPAPQKPGPGRPPGQPARDPGDVAVENLQDACSRLLWYISENPNSALGVRLARCAKAGVARERAEKGLALVEEAVALARVQMVAAYETPIREKGVAAKRPTVAL